MKTQSFISTPGRTFHGVWLSMEQVPREDRECPFPETSQPHLDTALGPCARALAGDWIGLNDLQRFLPTPTILGLCLLCFFQLSLGAFTFGTSDPVFPSISRQHYKTHLSSCSVPQRGIGALIHSYFWAGQVLPLCQCPEVQGLTCAGKESGGSKRVRQRGEYEGGAVNSMDVPAPSQIATRPAVPLSSPEARAI